MRLTKLYSCKHCTEGFVSALEHWKDQFFSSEDDYGHELIEMFDDKIHEVKLELEKLEPRKTKLKAYKFWNPSHAINYLPNVIDPHTCTAAELTKVETDTFHGHGRISTDILLIDDKQAEAVRTLFLNETVYEELRYEEIKEDV